MNYNFYTKVNPSIPVEKVTSVLDGLIDIATDKNGEVAGFAILKPQDLKHLVRTKEGTLSLISNLLKAARMK